MIPGIERELSAYLQKYPEDHTRLANLIERVGRGDNLSPRSDMNGHAVSSILTLDRTRTKALLIHHKAYGLWIPPGGHHEGNVTLHASAMRERAEETGLKQSRSPGGKPLLLDIDTHQVPARPEKNEGPHLHHDFIYLELCDEDFDPIIQADEVNGAEWRELSAIAAEGGRLKRLVNRVHALPSGALK